MVYLIAKRIIPPIMKLWLKKVSGLENVPKNGAFIMAANHASYMDHFVIMSTLVPYLDKKIYHLSKKEYFESLFKRLWHEHWGSVPIDRQSGGKEALMWAIMALKRGKIIAIHPEGTRSPTGKLMKGKTGVARLALKAKVPVIPVGLIGTFEILPKGKYIPKLKKATLNIGKPIYFDEYYKKTVTKKLLRKITTKIMKDIAKLSKQKYNFS